MREKKRLTKLEKSWILYDVGNSAFTLLVSTLLPIYFNALATSAGVDENMYLSYWGYAGSIATILVALIGPICGAMSDRKGFKKPLFVLFMLLGALGCAALGLAKGWLIFLGIFILAKVGFNGSLVFYDSMLPEISTEDRIDDVSTQGYAWGYIGSVIPFVICLVLVLAGGSFGLDQTTAMVVSFILTAVWWGVFTVPLLRRYKQTAYVERGKHPVIDTFRQLGQTFRKAKEQKHVFMYLIAFFFFINGVYTIIDMATAYGTDLGLDTTGLLLALLLTQIVAFPCAIIFGKLSAKHDSAKLMKICIICYTCITVFAVFLVSQWQFWLLATLVGMFQGAIQALSRSYLGKIVAAEQSGEFYGLMDICGKGASFFGMALVSFINQITADVEIVIFGLRLQNANLAVSVLVVLFIIGYILFCKADKLNKARQAS
ncbi:MAG: MFS transporter [Oscillospiraceae bacterium]|nr:MFS transporter [Oscillospiraceae bacterium]